MIGCMESNPTANEKHSCAIRPGRGFARLEPFSINDNTHLPTHEPRFTTPPEIWLGSPPERSSSSCSWGDGIYFPFRIMHCRALCVNRFREFHHIEHSC